MRTTSSEGARFSNGIPHPVVIGAVCLLVLAGIATFVPNEMATVAGAHFLTPQATLRANLLPREIPDGVPVSLSIQNVGEADDRLLSASTPVAQCVGVRRAFLVDGQRHSAAIPEGIVIPAEATIILEPGKSYLALYGLRNALVQGETFPLTIRFERAGVVTVIARVRRRVDAAGTAPLPEVSFGDLTVSLVSAPPAPALLSPSSRAGVARRLGALTPSSLAQPAVPLKPSRCSGCIDERTAGSFETSSA